MSKRDIINDLVPRLDAARAEIDEFTSLRAVRKLDSAEERSWRRATELALALEDRISELEAEISADVAAAELQRKYAPPKGWFVSQ